MKQIPIKEEDIPVYNLKAIKLIIILVVLGIITGLILSNIFVNEANEKIKRFNEFDLLNGKNPEWNQRPPEFENYSFEFINLSFSDIIFPTIGVVIVCISSYLLIGLIAVYFKIFMKSSSKYIVGLLMFLIPLFIQSIFSVNTLRQLFVSSGFPSPFHHFKESIGFGFGGLGSIIVILSIFEIIGLSILLYLSTE